jgi:Protein phosphatase 2C
MNTTLQALSQTEEIVNEDIYGFTDTEAWLLDGATSISGRRMEIGGRLETDASWFVRRFSDGLRMRSADVPFEQWLDQLLGDISAEAEHVWANWAATDTPSASFCHVRFDNHSAILSNLGDCRVLYQADGGSIETFGSCGVQTLDQELLNEFLSFRQQYQNATHKEVWELVVPRIRKNRTHMNNPNGYWILSPDAVGIKHLQRQEIPFQQALQIVMASDGLYRLVDTYFVLDEADFFRRALEVEGIPRLVSELRTIEAQDPKAKNFPRVKLQDDATGLSVITKKFT